MSSVNLELCDGCLPVTGCERDLTDSLTRSATPSLPNYYYWKAVIDRTFAAVLLIPGLPLLGILSLVVRATSPGPAIFRQPRMGKDGRVFTMYKLRSMRQDAEKRSGPVWASTADARVTRIGRWLRKLHLDELPQLFNVLKGDMSLIGPRPERPEFVAVLAEQIPGYWDRLTVLPGVTGLAQINLPPDQTLDDVRRKLVLDREYIEHAGLWLDLRMLACTLLRMVGTPGVLATRVTCVERRVELPSEADLFACGDDGADATPAALAGLYRLASVERAHANGNGHNGNGHNGHSHNGHGHNGNAHNGNGHARDAAKVELAHRVLPK